MATLQAIQEQEHALSRPSAYGHATSRAVNRLLFNIIVNVIIDVLYI